MNLSVENIVTFVGTDGYGLNADLLLDGKKIAFVIDNADGGEYHYDVLDKEKFQKVVAYAKTLKYQSEYFQGEEMTMDIDGLVCDICVKIEKEKTHKKMLKKTVNGFMFLSSDGKSYNGFSYKQSLKNLIAMYGVEKIQAGLDDARKKLPKHTLINENLAELGLK